MTFGQRFKIINVGKLLALMGSAAFLSDNVMEEDIMNIPTNSFLTKEHITQRCSS